MTDLNYLLLIIIHKINFMIENILGKAKNLTKMTVETFVSLYIIV